MPSRSLRMWQASARKALDEIASAHHAMRGVGRGRRYAAQQINQAYVVILTQGRKLDVGNPSPANIGSDFGRFGSCAGMRCAVETRAIQAGKSGWRI